MEDAGCTLCMTMLVVICICKWLFCFQMANFTATCNMFPAPQAAIRIPAASCGETP